MKTKALRNWTVIGLSVLTASASNAPAGQAATAGPDEKSYTGTVASVDTSEHILRVNGVFLHKDFNLGSSCAYSVLDNPAGTIRDLHPGQKVTVRYLKSEGVLVADRVEQQPLRVEGTVEAMDVKDHTLTVRHDGLDRTYQLADGYKIMLYDNRIGTSADIQPGSRVTVTYERPPGGDIAEQIAQTSQKFSGSLTAIDLTERTLKAQAVFGGKKFNMAADCTVVLNGKAGANLRDLKLGDRLVLNYEDVNGINIVNRIATTVGTPEAMTASSASQHGSSTPAAPGYTSY
jgi:Cu/Ag efflux protein CusF